MIFNDFIVNLMSQHVVPFWIALAVIFLIAMEVTYKKLVSTHRRRCRLVEFAIGMKFLAILMTAIMFLAVWLIGLLVELICYAIVPILMTIGVVGVIFLFFYSNYLVAKKYSKSYDFNAGDKLKVVDVEGLVPSALTKTPKDSIVTCIEKLPGKPAYKVKTKNGKIAERKEWRLERV